MEWNWMDAPMPHMPRLKVEKRHAQMRKMFSQELSEQFQPDRKDDVGRFFIDRDPRAFEVVLNYLRTGLTDNSDVERIGRARLLEEAKLVPIAALIATTALLFAVDAQQMGADGTPSNAIFIESQLQFARADYVHEMVFCPVDRKQQLQVWYWNDASRITAQAAPDLAYPVMPPFIVDNVDNAVFDNVEICVGKTQCGITAKFGTNLPISAGGKLAGMIINSFDKQNIGDAYYTSGKALRGNGTCKSMFWTNLQKHLYPVFAASDDWTLLDSSQKGLPAILEDPALTFCNAARCTPTIQFDGRSCDATDVTNTCTSMYQPIGVSKFNFDFTYQGQATQNAYDMFFGLLEAHAAQYSGPPQPYEKWTFLCPECPYQVDTVQFNNVKTSVMVSLKVGPFVDQKHTQAISATADAVMGYKLNAAPKDCTALNTVNGALAIGAAVLPAFLPLGAAAPVLAGVLSAAGGALTIAAGFC
ncbi:hypothetical protein M427DRAFT_34736 [Gonapodya prolifera JEL478]|uniref:Potassium channel tetramerisation-type BTB domain-containing protein n=1 Tax=Gonapodya prolifera (strain JEL478) TaxID=1344416 RepID=A0A139A6W0_GONPJ|nr:hypothetical protein M427DRAFT_34736 [Gonapodya prolifera JEL478]|eukprot:KXS12556.1 hypothetical protein M427DRAFT_34736 [Gonapodya prolifera JEL478]